MSFFSSRVLVASLVTGGLVTSFAACSADGDSSDLFDAVPMSRTEQGEDASDSLLPPTSPQDSGPAADARVEKPTQDAAADADADDAGVDAGPPMPEPGTACAVANAIFERACGACGKQSALCLADPDGGPGGHVTEYSACVGEVAGGCVPGTVEEQGCGKCGTRTRTCTKYCAWKATACTGEPANACNPTSIDLTSAGCMTPGTFRTRSCDATTCGWSGFTGCEPLAFRLTAPAQLGQTASGVYPLRGEVVSKRATGTCGTLTFSPTADHPYVHVEVVNPTAQTLTVSAWNTYAAEGSASIATTMAVYDGSRAPVTDEDRNACNDTVSTWCPVALCGAMSFAALTGATAFTIPAGGSVVVAFQSYNARATGDVRLVVRTDAAE